MDRSSSRHNIVGRVGGHGAPFVVNLLAGSADLLSEEEAALLAEGRGPESLAERGYLVDPAEEDARYRKAFLAAADARDDDEVQLFFSLSYACNFSCTYCFQAEYAPPSVERLDEVVDAFFRYVDTTFAGRRRYLTLFGGEPLLRAPAHLRALERLIDGAAARDLDVAVVTNGYHLAESLDLLLRARIREVQVTLDGVGPLHDARRPTRGGGRTFDRIVEGIDLALARGVTINLRVVVDRENLEGLPELARFAAARGWTENPRFKTQIGRNYELHVCQVERDRLFGRSELGRALHDLAKRHPEVLALHRPAFSVARHLADHGELPEPLFDACPGCKTEWAFDFTGRIYPCTATVGKEGEAVGRFHPVVELDEALVADWEDRDVASIPECTSCPVRLACGGGCASVAKNRTGKVAAPDCRPVAELIGLGLDLYLEER